MLSRRFKNRPLLLLLLAAVVVNSLGCGTLFTPNALKIDVKSYPPGAQVYLDDKLLGVTPLEYEIKPMESERLEFKLDGYQTRRERIEPAFNWISLLDILLWPTFIVDIITGKMFRGEDITVTMIEGVDEAPVVRRTTPTPVRRTPTRAAAASEEFEPVVPPAGFNRISAAVLPIIPQQSASLDDAALLTDVLEQSIYEQGRYLYTLVDRTVVEQTIKEQGFQNSDYSEQAAAELGRMLNIRHVIVGTYTQSGDGSFNALGVRIIDVETNVIKARQTVNESSTGAMARVMPKAAHDLLVDLLERGGM